MDARPRIVMQVTKDVVGYSYMYNYQNRGDHTPYLVPTYRMNVCVKDSMGQWKVVGQNEVVRFGISSEDSKHRPVEPYVSGLEKAQAYEIYDWDPTRELTSNREVEKGAFYVDYLPRERATYLVHAGPDDPRSAGHGLVGASGCIEVCGKDGKQQWTKFIDTVLEESGIIPGLSICDKITRARYISTLSKDAKAAWFKKLIKTRKLFIDYQAAKKPDRVYTDAQKDQFLKDVLQSKVDQDGKPKEPPPFQIDPKQIMRPFRFDYRPVQLIGKTAADLRDNTICASPLILDLDGDGVKTRGLDQRYTYFDHDADGFAERTGWVSSDDGLLVWDRNQNGRIDNGRELFGDETLLESGSRAANGFAALKDLDTNQNGKIDAGDDQFSSLRIWRDQYSDGWCDSTELFTLDELGIQSIDVASNLSSYVDPQGNAHKQTGTFARTDGTTGQVADVWFRTDRIDTISETPEEIPEDFEELPNLPGFGTVESLWQAMAGDGTGQLQSLVQEFAQEPDSAERHRIVRNLLSGWTGANKVNAAGRGSYVDAETVHIVESFTGQSFQGRNGADPTKFEAPALLRSYRTIHELAYGQLMASTHFKDNYDNYTWDQELQRPKSDLEFLAEAYEKFKQTGEIDPELFQKFPGQMGNRTEPLSVLEKNLDWLLTEMFNSLEATGLADYVSPYDDPFPDARSAEESRF